MLYNTQEVLENNQNLWLGTLFLTQFVITRDYIIRIKIYLMEYKVKYIVIYFSNRLNKDFKLLLNNLNIE